jgi:hypothetical protein
MTVLKQYNPATSEWETIVVGKQGPQGPIGEPGVEISGTPPTDTSLLWIDSDDVGDMVVPAGGSTGEVLAKTSGSNYDTGWVAPQLVGGAARPLLSAGAFLDGVNGLVLRPVAGNFASTPDSAALDITGDIDIKAKVTLTDWTPTNAAYVVGKFQATAERSYVLVVTTLGRLELITTTDGTAVTQIGGTSTVSTGVADGDTKWIRGTLDVDNGSSQRVYKFYTSDDGTTWTQLGTTVTTAGITSIHSGTSQLEIGTVLNAGSAANVLDGTVHRAVIQSAFDTVDNSTNVVFDADFAAQTADALAFTESSTNAATVRITSTRYFYGLPNRQFTSVTTQNFPLNNDFFTPFLVTEPVVVDLLAWEVTAAPASTATVYAVIYAATGDQQPTGPPLVSFGSITVATSVTGLYQTQITPVTLQPGAYVIGLNTSVSFTVRTFRTPEVLVAALGGNPITLYTRTLRDNAPFPTTSVGWRIRDVATVGREVFSVLRWRPA